MEVQERRQRWRTVQLLAVAMLVVGTAVAVAAAKRGQVPELPPPLEFLAVPLGNLAIFAVLVAVGLYNRRKRQPQATDDARDDRDGGRRARSPLVAYWRACVFESAAEHIDVYEPDRRISVGLLLYDLITRGRVHSAFLWGGISVMVWAYTTRELIGGTATWLSLAGWLTR